MSCWNMSNKSKQKHVNYTINLCRDNSCVSVFLSLTCKSYIKRFCHQLMQSRSLRKCFKKLTLMLSEPRTTSLGVEGKYACACVLIAMAAFSLLPTPDLFHQSHVSPVQLSSPCTIKPSEFDHFQTFEGCRCHMGLQGNL